MSLALTARRRLLALGLAGVLATLLGASTAAPASAADSSGTLTFNPGKGLDTSPMWVISSGPCPAASKFLALTMYGSGIPADGLVVMTTTKAGISRTERMIAAFQDNLAGLASSSGFTLKGPYKLVLACQNQTGTQVDATFTGVLTFTDAHHFTATETALTFPAGEIPGGRPVITSPSPSASAGSSTGPSASASAGSSTDPSTGASAGSPTDPSAAATDAGSAAQASGSTSRASDNASNWFIGGLGVLLVLLGLGWVIRGRMSDAAPADSPATPTREDQNVAP